MIRATICMFFLCGALGAETLTERFAAPQGFRRVPADSASFGEWLRRVPLQDASAPVLLFDGRPKARQDVHAAVLDVSIGERDLQQCADAVMRLRAEYLRDVGREQEIAFNFTSGDRCAWSEWRIGKRPVIKGNQVQWRDTDRRDSSASAFREYLATVFTYAGSASLEQELSAVPPLDVLPGDVFIQGGYPGHAVIVMDVVMNEQGAKQMLLAQSYMPAQSIHVLLNPLNGSPWYDARESGPLPTPEWEFRYDHLHRFPE